MTGRLTEGALASLDAVENGSAVNIASLEGVKVHVSGTFVGTWIIQISYDGGTTWADFATGTAAALSAELPPCGRLRGICSAYTSGTIVMNYGGRNKNQLPS